jgi:hypothetical protein
MHFYMHSILHKKFILVKKVGVTSTKDRVIGVDTPGQQVSPRVRYGTTCLLIRVALGSVPCSDEGEIDIVTHLGSHGARGVIVPLLA